MMGSPIRFAGLVSGMDTQSMVQQLMRAEGMRMDRLTQRRQRLIWRQEDLRNTMTRLNDFRHANTRMNPGTGTSAITNMEHWQVMQTEVSVRSGQGSAAGFNVTATNAAREGSFDVTVERVAAGDLARGNNMGESINVNRETMRELLQFTPAQGNNAGPGSRWILNDGTVLVEGPMTDASHPDGAGRRTFTRYDDPTGPAFVATTTGAGALQFARQVPTPQGLSPGAMTEIPTPAGTEVWRINNQFFTAAQDGGGTTVFTSLSNPAETFTREPDGAGGYVLRPTGAPDDSDDIAITSDTNLSNDFERFFELNGYVFAQEGAVGSGGEIVLHRLNDNAVFTGIYNEIGPNYGFQGMLTTTVYTTETIHLTNMRLESVWDANPGNRASNTQSTININGVNITMNYNDTIQTFMNRVNASAAGVNMGWDNARQVFTLEARGTGADAVVRTGNDDWGFFQAIGLESIQAPAASPPNTPPPAPDSRLLRTASDSVIYFDSGNPLGGIRMEQSSNRFEVEGFIINLNSSAVHTTIDEATDVITVHPTTFTIDTTRNIDNLVQSISYFVEQYNNLIRELNALHSTPRPRSGARGPFFEPLTDEQRQAMSDREVERWEEQARTGMLHRNDAIRGLQNDLRHWMFSGVPLPGGGTLALHQIGITSVGANGNRADRMIGVLEIDEDQLRRALNGELERTVGSGVNAERVAITAADVQYLFTGSSNWTSAVTNEARSARIPNIGLAHRIDDILNNATDERGSIGRVAGREGGINHSTNPMTTDIRRYDDRIEQMQRWLMRRESHFFQMFARMEQAMAQSNAQMDSLFAFMSM